jgi:hypothetical protein
MLRRILTNKVSEVVNNLASITPILKPGDQRTFVVSSSVGNASEAVDLVKEAVYNDHKPCVPIIRKVECALDLFGYEWIAVVTYGNLEDVRVKDTNTMGDIMTPKGGSGTAPPKAPEGAFSGTTKLPGFVPPEGWGSTYPPPQTKITVPIEKSHTGSKYIRVISPTIVQPGYGTEPILVDCYQIAEACEVKSATMTHALKKILYAGVRGKATYRQDILEAIDALKRAVELHDQREFESRLPSGVNDP